MTDFFAVVAPSLSLFTWIYVISFFFQQKAFVLLEAICQMAKYDDRLNQCVHIYDEKTFRRWVKNVNYNTINENTHQTSGISFVGFVNTIAK